jgi:WD40 repeat protein
MSRVTVQKLHSLSGHTDCVYALHPAGDGRRFFSAGGDGMVVLWDLESPGEGDLIARVPRSVYAIHELPLAGMLVVAQNFEGLHLIDWNEKKERATLKLPPASYFDIQSHGNDLFVASGDGSVVQVDVEQWRIKNRLVHSAKSARTLALNPRKGEMAVGYSDFSLRVFDLDSGLLRAEWPAHSNSVFTLAYSPDGDYLLSGSRDARLKVWDASNFRLHHEVVAHMFAINHIAFSPDGRHFVTCSRDRSIKVWEREGWNLLKVIDKARHAGHGTSVNKLWWSPYNKNLVSAGDDRSVAVWSLQLTPEHEDYTP